MEREKKESILKAAAHAFTRFGLKKASVDDIAREAGVAKGTVYLAAQSKEDLFYQVLHREVRSWAASVAASSGWRWCGRPRRSSITSSPSSSSTRSSRP